MMPNSALNPSIPTKLIMNIKKIQKQLSDFADERDWNQFHNPKNLAMALSVEASELVEIFQWLTPEQAEEIMSTNESEHVKEEIADVMIYLIRLADKLNVDLEDAVADKIIKNGEKYPIDTSKGSTTKRTTLKEKIKDLIAL
jgi:NTP pyrophosphatase (non-canonical NTP hydrolase)